MLQFSLLLSLAFGALCNKGGKNDGMCDTRKDYREPDSCRRCKRGHRWAGWGFYGNDWCCTEADVRDHGDCSCEARETESEVGAFGILNSVKNQKVCDKSDCTTKCRKDEDLLSPHKGQWWCNVRINANCNDQKYTVANGHFSYIACNRMKETSESEVGSFGILNSIKNSKVCDKSDCTTKCRKNENVLSPHKGQWWCNVRIDADCNDQKYTIAKGHYSYVACNRMTKTSDRKKKTPRPTPDCCRVDADAKCKKAGNDDGCGRTLQLGEGDCDRNSDCAGSLVCGFNNCPWGDEDDCCTYPAPSVANAIAYALTEKPVSSTTWIIYGLAAVGLGCTLYGAGKFYTKN